MWKSKGRRDSQGMEERTSGNERLLEILPMKKSTQINSSKCWRIFTHIIGDLGTPTLGKLSERKLDLGRGSFLSQQLCHFPLFCPQSDWCSIIFTLSGECRRTCSSASIAGQKRVHILPSAALPDSRPFSSMLSSCQLSLFLEEHFLA